VRTSVGSVHLLRDLPSLPADTHVRSTPHLIVLLCMLLPVGLVQLLVVHSPS
jgi:hypothetical protein